MRLEFFVFFFFQAEDGIRDYKVTGVQTCALPILNPSSMPPPNAALALRKRRRERSRLSRSTRPIARLEVMSGSFLVARRSPRRVLDPVTYAHIGPAAADVSGHRSVDVGVVWLRVGGKQCRRRHDLAGLAIAALGHLEIDPGLLNILAGSRGANGLDRRNALAGHGGDRRYA